MLEHEVDLLRGYLLGGDNQIAFVLAVLVINDDDELTFLKVGNGLFYCA